MCNSFSDYKRSLLITRGAHVPTETYINSLCIDINLESLKLKTLEKANLNQANTPNIWLLNKRLFSPFC